MSSARWSLLLAAPIAAAGAVVIAPWQSAQGWQALEQALDAPRLAAATGNMFADTDGDLLPDRLEWVLLLDPNTADTDGDETDDFLHAVQRRRELSEPRSSFGYDHEARVIVTSVPDPRGIGSIWVHMLFRFAGSDPRDLQCLQELQCLMPYLDHWGIRVPVDRLIGAGGVRLVFRPHATEGLYALCSFEIGSESMLRSLLPCTIGATAVIGGRTVCSGTYLANANGITAAMVPVAPDTAVLQTLAPDNHDDPFWTSSRVCMIRLAVVSSSSSGTLAEVSAADCVSSGKLACPPTCLSSRGQMMFFPDGLATITGGSR